MVYLFLTKNLTYAYRPSSKEEILLGYPKCLFAHREVMSVQIKSIPEKVDHKNHNGLDNQKSNLRMCSVSQNGSNQRKRNNEKKLSKYKGVSFKFDCHKKWDARIGLNGKTIRAKRSETQEQAALEYNKLAVKHYGEFANLNIIQP